MKPTSSLFIVLEGSDGSGKTTQLKLLAERLRAAGHDVDVYDFPRYDEPSSHFVKQYLNGEYGPASEVNPYAASLFYALDRFEAAPMIRQSLADGKIVLADRYVGANMVHQGAKFVNSGEQRGYFMWDDSLEFQLLGIPRPSINLLLRVPADVSYELIKKRAPRSYTAKQRDEHEADIEHLRRAVAAYHNLYRLFPKDFQIVECSRGGKLLPITEINNRIWQRLKSMLPEPTHNGHSAVVNLDEKPVSSNSQKKLATRSHRTAETVELQDISLLALSKLATFEGIEIKYSLSWPPKQAKVRLNYYIPPQMPAQLAKKYRQTMDKIVGLSQRLAKSLGRNGSAALEATAPLAWLLDAELSGSLESIDNLMSSLSADQLPELRALSVNHAPKAAAKKATIKQLAQNHLGRHGADFSGVKILDVWPRNEFDLLVKLLYPHSSLGHEEIAAEIDSWSYDQKAEALKVAVAEDAKAVLSKISYRFDAVEGWPNFEQLRQVLKPTAVQVQPATPRYGYGVPDSIEANALIDQFMECFDLSLAMYSQMQAAGLEDLASYCVLCGHHRRWQFSVRGDVIWFGRDNATLEPATLRQLMEQAKEFHPLIAQAFQHKESSATRSSAATKPRQVKRA